MNRNVVEVMSKVAQKLAVVKKNFADLHDKNKIDIIEYEKNRNLLDNCQFELANYCDCAPIRLINGEIDTIIANAIDI